MENGDKTLWEFVGIRQTENALMQQIIERKGRKAHTGKKSKD